jgi:probable F420-dependent oxidoreductase
LPHDTLACNAASKERTDMGRLGIALSYGLNASRIVEYAQLAESLGYDSVWMAEGHGGDQFAVLAAVATQTSRVKLGTCISSVFVRSAPTIAMAAATVDQLSGGRFILGLGSSHKVQVGPEHGMPYRKPVTRVRETVEVVQQLLRDGRVQYEGETVNIENFELWFVPLRARLPIYLAAVFPKMMGVCGEMADGVILTRTTLESVADAKQHIGAAAKARGRDPSQVVVTSLFPTAAAANPQHAFDALRPGVAMYSGFFPRYNRMFADRGFGDEAAKIAEAWSRGDRAGATKAASDGLIDATCIVGTAQQCRDKIDAYRNAGIDLPIIAPATHGPNAEAEVEATIRACAPG